jgi:hypothetical protein
MDWKQPMKRWTAPVIAVLMIIGAVAPAGGVDAAPRQTTVPGAYRPADPVPLHASPDHSRTKARNKAEEGVYGPSNPHYQINVFYDSQAHRVTGTMKVNFTNNLKKDLKELYFNLWGNASVVREHGGGMSVSSVKVNGKTAAFEQKDTALHISDITVKKGSRSSAWLKFAVQVPENKDRFGWDGKTVSLGNWFPILAVYDQEGWNVDPYYPYGESFYSLTGNFDVTVTTDKEQVIATSGTEVDPPRVKGKFATHRYQAKQVRDFAMEMNPDYHVKKAKAGNVDINVYYTDKHAKYADAMLESGIDSIKLFSEKFGQYPWPELDIVSMEGWFGGMEYPQLIMISLTDDRTQGWVKSVTAHEIGHQWFYGIIGNNEYDEPWLDESFATFSAALYDKKLEKLTAEPHPDPYYHLSSPVSAFTARGEEGIDAYYQMIYSYGARTLNDLRKELGDKPFYQSMQTWFQEQKFGIATTKEFIDTMERTSGKNLDKFFEAHRVYLSDQE